jgi:hypothetical protein
VQKLRVDEAFYTARSIGNGWPLSEVQKYFVWGCIVIALKLAEAEAFDIEF